MQAGNVKWVRCPRAFVSDSRVFKVRFAMFHFGSNVCMRNDIEFQFSGLQEAKYCYPSSK